MKSLFGRGLSWFIWRCCYIVLRLIRVRKIMEVQVTWVGGIQSVYLLNTSVQRDLCINILDHRVIGKFKISLMSLLSLLSTH